MARPLRLEFAGALYHVTSRGDGREAIFLADGDRRLFLDVLAGVGDRFNWSVHAYCLMTNHYHLLVETPDANLSKGMRQLNGVYTQRFNRTYTRSGHVFQGRYKAILAQKESESTGIGAPRGTQSRTGWAGEHARRLAVEQLPGNDWRGAGAGLVGDAHDLCLVQRNRAGGRGALHPICRRRQGAAFPLAATEESGLPRLGSLRRVHAAHPAAGSRPP